MVSIVNEFVVQRADALCDTQLFSKIAGSIDLSVGFLEVFAQTVSEPDTT